MKKISAVLLIVAVLNPLCCCYAFGDAITADEPMKVDHSCCHSASGSSEPTGNETDSTSCEHEEIQDSAINANTHVVVPVVHFVAHTPSYSEPHDFKYLRNSMEAFEKKFEASQSIQRWVGVQTDCVRRL